MKSIKRSYIIQSAIALFAAALLAIAVTVKVLPFLGQATEQGLVAWLGLGVAWFGWLIWFSVLVRRYRTLKENLRLE